jgi:Cu+-exporting ATPase
MSELSKDSLKTAAEPAAELNCYHCGEPCPDDRILIEDKYFCCQGCKTVYEILNSSGMCQYYDLDENPGISLKGKSNENLAYLDEPDIVERLLDFTDGENSRITFFIPQMHCSSCIWLLENLYKLNDGILASKVNFLKKEAYITYKEGSTTLRKVVELLDNIGYAPHINLNSLDESDRPTIDRKFFYRLGVAGFAFGNIMLLSFPEYLGIDRTVDERFVRLFGYLNILLALPVVFYSGRIYLQSAWAGLRQRTLNIDVPISLGMLTLFGRSLFEILTHTGAGYLDSLAGLVFFLLVGRWFQQRTYNNIQFDRDYKSYFPIAATIKTEDGEKPVSLEKLKPGDNIIIRHNELIPADSRLMAGQANVDYSFVTGESEPVRKEKGDRIFAGGRQLDGSIEVTLTKHVSQSYLTQLWNDEAFTKEVDSKASQLADRAGKFFTYIILLVAFITLFYWLPRDMAIAINAFTAVLIIACPCAVALTIPFIFGNVLRILGKQECYLKNTQVIEALSNIDTIIVDKTGTITQRDKGKIRFIGEALNPEERRMVAALTAPSNHPVSQMICSLIHSNEAEEAVKISGWKEITGKGVEGNIGQNRLKIGSGSFMGHQLPDGPLDNQGVYLQINDKIRGHFKIDHYFRPGTREVIAFFQEMGPVYLLSGDNERERSLLQPMFQSDEHLKFQQSPQDKLAFVRQLQKQGKKVLMLGDGLNDAGALKQSDAGLVVTENTNNFTPACDGILNASQFENLPKFIHFARKSINLVYLSYVLALIYNIAGLSFAVQGALSPVIAAILMPLSSITIVVFGVLSSNLLYRRLASRRHGKVGLKPTLRN